MLKFTAFIFKSFRVNTLFYISRYFAGNVASVLHKAFVMDYFRVVWCFLSGANLYVSDMCCCGNGWCQIETENVDVLKIPFI